MAGTPPSVPLEFQLYDSYSTDPIWQRYFTYSWVALAGVFVLSSTPYVYRQFRNGNYKRGWSIQEEFPPARTSVRDHISHPSGGKEFSDDPNPGESPSAPHYSASRPHRYKPLPRLLVYLSSLFQTLTSLHLPLPFINWRNLNLTSKSKSKGVSLGTQLSDCCRKGYVPLTVGQAGLVGLYLAGAVVVMLKDAQLTFNANRPGFIALAMLTPLFLLTTKNNPLGLLLGLGYEKLNWAHRWVGRIVWLAATIHGSIWINGYRGSSAMTQDKTLRGLASWIILTFLAITSIRPVRRRWYELFWIAHFTSVVGFFAAICYHTPYSRPWIWPPVALYTLDLVLRMFRYRMKDGMLVALDENFTMIHIPDCDAGWLPTQHVRIRVLAGSGMFESHPFTITNAPIGLTTGNGDAQRGITLFAKVSGDWSRKLNTLSREESLGLEYNKLRIEDTDGEEKEVLQTPIEEQEPEDRLNAVPVKILIDGPYGGLKLDMAKYHSAMLIAGGSGVTFVMGCVEECFRRRGKRGGVSGGGVGKVEVIWVVRDMSTIEAFAPMLHYLHERAAQSGQIDLSFRLHLTRPPSPLPTSPPALLAPFSTLSPYRPSISQLVQEALPPPTIPELEDGKQRTCCTHGGMAVIACGPEGIVAESRNAVATLGLADRVRLGGVDFHGECYAI